MSTSRRVRTGTRRVIGALALSSALVVAGCSSSRQVSSTGPDGTAGGVDTVVDTAATSSTSSSSSTTSTSTSTTVPSTTVAPTTVAPTAPPTTAAPTTVPGSGSPPLGTGGALLRPAAAGAPELVGFGAAADCTALGAAPFTVESCGLVDSTAGTLIWAVFVDGADATHYAGVFAQSGPDTWVPALDVHEDFEGAWTAARFAQGDFDGDGADELLFGARIAGSGGYLELDIVDITGGNPVVGAHLELERGAAIGESGRVRTQEAFYAPTDAACCPTKVNRLTIRLVNGSWRVVDSEQVPAGSPPSFTSQFP